MIFHDLIEFRMNEELSTTFLDVRFSIVEWRALILLKYP